MKLCFPYKFVFTTLVLAMTCCLWSISSFAAAKRGSAGLQEVHAHLKEVAERISVSRKHKEAMSPALGEIYDACEQCKKYIQSPPREGLVFRKKDWGRLQLLVREYFRTVSLSKPGVQVQYIPWTFAMKEFVTAEPFTSKILYKDVMTKALSTDVLRMARKNIHHRKDSLGEERVGEILEHIAKLLGETHNPGFVP